MTPVRQSTFVLTCHTTVFIFNTSAKYSLPVVPPPILQHVNKNALYLSYHHLFFNMSVKMLFTCRTTTYSSTCQSNAVYLSYHHLFLSLARSPFSVRLSTAMLMISLRPEPLAVAMPYPFASRFLPTCSQYKSECKFK